MTYSKSKITFSNTQMHILFYLFHTWERENERKREKYIEIDPIHWLSGQNQKAGTPLGSFTLMARAQLLEPSCEVYAGGLMQDSNPRILTWNAGNAGSIFRPYSLSRTIFWCAWIALSICWTPRESPEFVTQEDQISHIFILSNVCWFRTWLYWYDTNSSFKWFLLL